MSSYTNTPNLDILFLQTLMGRLQIRPPNPPQPQLFPSFKETLDDLLMNTLNNISDIEDDDENKTRLAKEESKLEKEVIRIILSGNTEEALKPNSGQAVTIGEHYICVGYHMDAGSGYRVWEWHGHIMLFDDENGGYDPEYIYGNYFEKMKEEEKPMNSGLKDLIGATVDGGSGRILHRNMNTGPSRV